MDFKKLVVNRYSCRNFSSRPVAKNIIDSVLDAVRMAPSACNRQPWTFFVVSNPDIRQRILSKSRPAFLDAPITIVAVGHHDSAWHRPSDQKDHTDVDVSIAVEHLCLAATEHGLSTCWVCSFDTEATKQALNLHEGEEPIALIPIGYPADDNIPEKNRKSYDEIVKWVL